MQLFVYFVGLLFSAAALAVEAPAQPSNLYGYVYSTNAVDLFWDGALPTESIARYQVFRNGQYVDTKYIPRFYQERQPAGTTQRYDVYAEHRDGRRSPPARITLVIPPRELNDGFELTLAQSRFDVREGSESVLVVPIAIDRSSATGRNIELSVQTGIETRGLSFHFDRSTLGPDQTAAQLRVTLPVGMAPIKYHRRRIQLIADDGRTTRIKEVILDLKPINVPDVYLLIGQSNMVGASNQFAKNAEPGGADEPSARIRQLNVTMNSQSNFSLPQDFTDESKNALRPLFVVAEDPLHFPLYPGTTRKQAGHIGLGLSFAKSALENTARDIYLVPAAWSGTGFCAGNRSHELAWNSVPSNDRSLGGTRLLERALTRLNMTLRETGGVLRGILWHQGEADSYNLACANSYRSNLQHLVERVRSDARVDPRGPAARGRTAAVPFILGTMSRGSDEDGSYEFFGSAKDIVDQAHRSIGDSVPWSAYANADDLVPPAYPCGSGSCIHFGAAAYREIGHRYYMTLTRILDWN